MVQEERRNQLTDILKSRLSPDEITNFDIDRFSKKVQTFVDFEIELERRLRQYGYYADTINRKRTQIRNIVFYAKDGSLLKESTLKSYLTQMRNDFLSSIPYNKLCNARDNCEIHLYKPGDLFFSLFQHR